MSLCEFNMKSDEAVIEQVLTCHRMYISHTGMYIVSLW